MKKPLRCASIQAKEFFAYWDGKTPRKPRFFLPGVPAHILQRGDNRQPVFFDDDDHLAYLGWLREDAHRHGCEVHAYVLMTNYVLATPPRRSRSAG